ncbi:SCO family protein [Candidatus Sororendozoicomonas aggregata]|uniref:SCO family protein n=1 Tax=Candidatus Sororendozoicomonas aggregata TaxID=3073239 RepID=UPI002ED55F1C
MNNTNKAIKKTVFALLAVIAVILGGTVYKYLNKPPLTKEQLQGMGAIVFDTPRSFNVTGLVNHRGQPFTKESLTGNWTIMYFGYTFCPDICPATLGQLNKMDKRLKETHPELAAKIHYVMVTVDPARDTVEKLSGYVPYFNPDFVGLTGGIKAIYDLTQQLNVAFTPVTNPKDAFYLVDHSANLAIINPKGDHHGFIRPPLDSTRIITIIQAMDELF